MRFAIAYSKKDLAGKNIVNQLKKISFIPQTPIIELKPRKISKNLDFPGPENSKNFLGKETIFSEDLSPKNYPKLRNIDFLVFASKHQSEKKENSLCLHAPGNWRNADFGGQSGKICNTSALILKYLFKQLNKNTEFAKDNNQLDKDYNITLEVTHHGPLTEIPCCFIEVGSQEQEWRDEQACKIIAKTILSLQNYKPNKNLIPCIGIGGPHYAPNFNKIQLNSDYAISHIIPEYVLPLTESMLKQAEEKTKEQIKFVLLDWKGLGKSEQRQQTISLLNKFNLKYKRTSHIEK